MKIRPYQRQNLRRGQSKTVKNYVASSLLIWQNPRQVILPVFVRGLFLKKFMRNFSPSLFSVLFSALLSTSVIFGLCADGSFAQAQAGNLVAGPITVPLFRHIDPTKPDPDFKAYPVIRFTVTDDFPPFSYRTSNGALTGFNVAIANALCRILRVECLFSVKAFSDGLQTITNKEADALIIGLAQNSDTEKFLSFTRPYYRFSARFAVRQASAINANDGRAMAGKRLGVIAGTQHATFLKDNFQRSKIREFDDASDAFEGLRTGAVDALFGDSLQLMFWLKGTKSKACCRFVGDAYLDLRSFSHPMSIAVGANNKKLRDLLDHALDRLQISGRYSKIFQQYFPLSPWKSPANNSEKKGGGAT